MYDTFNNLASKCINIKYNKKMDDREKSIYIIIYLFNRQLQTEYFGVYYERKSNFKLLGKLRTISCKVLI